jgi:hypothetical protein
MPDASFGMPFAIFGQVIFCFGWVFTVIGPLDHYC